MRHFVMAGEAGEQLAQQRGGNRRVYQRLPVVVVGCQPSLVDVFFNMV
jgi:hypothetical protein